MNTITCHSSTHHITPRLVTLSPATIGQCKRALTHITLHHSLMSSQNSNHNSLHSTICTVRYQHKRSSPSNSIHFTSERLPIPSIQRKPNYPRSPSRTLRNDIITIGCSGFDRQRALTLLIGLFSLSVGKPNPKFMPSSLAPHPRPYELKGIIAVEKRNG